MTSNLGDAQPLSKMMGVQVTEAGKDRIRAELLVREDLCTTGKTIHGGAIMAFADSLGALGAFMNLPDGANGTTTIESKTNFLRAAPQGSTVSAETTPVHIGRKLSVWKTIIRREDGKDVAVVTQTQLVL